MPEFSLRLSRTFGSGTEDPSMTPLGSRLGLTVSLRSRRLNSACALRGSLAPVLRAPPCSLSAVVLVRPFVVVVEGGTCLLLHLCTRCSLCRPSSVEMVSASLVLENTLIVRSYCLVLEERLRLLYMHLISTFDRCENAVDVLLSVLPLFS